MQSNEQADIVITKLNDIINKNLIKTEVRGSTQDAVVDEFVQMLAAEKIIDSKETVKQAIYDREAESSTGLGMNIAIPHAKSSAVKQPAVVFGRSQEGIDWK